MAYYLGIDLGTTYTAAAIWRDGRVEIANLGTRAPVVPSVILLRDDGTVLTGEAAERRALTEPQRVAREFKRRVGDSTPIIIGGTPYSADGLTGRLLRWVVETVAEREGEPPAGVVVSHPANWGPFKKDLLLQAISLADLDRASTITEPEAAAIHYASQERVEPGSVIAVYDLGGGTFDAAVLRRSDHGWEILGEPEGVERLGGVDFDQAVLHHVRVALGDAIDSLDPDDDAAVAALSRLRRDCVEAKEALASDVDVVIPVMLPTIQTDVRLTRAEFEAMIRPTLVDSIAALRRALRSAGVEPGDVSAVLLVGGSSRIPLVAQLIGSELGRPVAVDAHPKHGVALGAAIIAAEQGTGRSVDTEIVPTIDIAVPLAADTPPDPPAPAPAAAPPEPVVAAAPAAPLLDAVALGAATVGTGPTRPTEAVGSAPGGPDLAPTQPMAEAPATERMPGTGGPGVPAPPPRPLAAQGAPPGGPRRGPGGQPGGPLPSGGSLPGQGGPPGGPGSAGGGGGADKRRPALLAAVAGLVVVAVVGAALALNGGGGGDDDGGGEAAAGDIAQPDTTLPTDANQPVDGTPAPTAPSTTSTTEPVPAGPTVQLDTVTVEDGFYRVDYTIDGYTPDQNDPEALHTHFFLDTTTPEAAGTNGAPPGDWDLTFESGTFLTKYGPDNKGTATEMCVTVADSNHGVVDPYSGNCVPLPE